MVLGEVSVHSFLNLQSGIKLYGADKYFVSKPGDSKQPTVFESLKFLGQQLGQQGKVEIFPSAGLFDSLTAVRNWAHSFNFGSNEGALCIEVCESTKRNGV